MADCTDTVNKLKRRLQQVVQNTPQEDQVLKLINRLSSVNMTLHILQETRIGKEVNALRKWKGQVGEKAKQLVRQWKELLPAGCASALPHRSIQGGGEGSSRMARCSDNSLPSRTLAHDLGQRPHMHTGVAQVLPSNSDAFSDALSEEIQPYDAQSSRQPHPKSHRSKTKSKQKKRSVQGSEDLATSQSHTLSSEDLSSNARSHLHRGLSSVNHSSEFVQENLTLQSEGRFDSHSNSAMDGFNEQPNGPGELERTPPALPIVPKKRKANVDLSDAVALSKKSRTMVYSGSTRKSVGPQVVPSLFDLSMKVLIDNIDAIEGVGDVPYFILEPVLQKCTATQLMRLESCNPHFLEDSDILWQKHCQREFKRSVPPSGQTWRDLYIDKVDEREQRLKKLTEDIGAKEKARKEPLRMAKLAAPTRAPVRSRHKATPIPGKLPFFNRARYGRGLEKQVGSTGLSPLMKQTMKMAKERKLMMMSRPGK